MQEPHVLRELISNLPLQPGMTDFCCMHFICHTLGSFMGETQDETSLNVLVQFSPFTFPVRPSCFLCKALQMVTSIFLDSPLEIIVFSS
jgi:hypothetical protein